MRVLGQCKRFALVADPLVSAPPDTTLHFSRPQKEASELLSACATK